MRLDNDEHDESEHGGALGEGYALLRRERAWDDYGAKERAFGAGACAHWREDVQCADDEVEDGDGDGDVDVLLAQALEAACMQVV